MHYKKNNEHFVCLFFCMYMVFNGIMNTIYEDLRHEKEKKIENRHKNDKNEN
jgi:hypothetical protein